VGGIGSPMHVQFHLAMMCRRIQDTQGTQLLSSQAGVKKDRQDQLVHNGSCRAITSGLIRAIANMREELLFLCFRQGRCRPGVQAIPLSSHWQTYHLWVNTETQGLLPISRSPGRIYIA
jgi:hypothetical protein